MIESFFLKSNFAHIESAWEKKIALTARILQQEPLRALRPDLVGDRRRLDLMYYSKRLGIRGPSDEQGNFEFHEIVNSDAASPLIQDMMDSFVSSRCPLKLAQIRFRESASGHQGLWIDTSNEQIKELIEEKNWITRFLLRGWVLEAGQRHKEFILNSEGAIKFQTAQARPWLASYTPHNEEIPLLSYASLFSQAGPEVNRSLIVSGLELLDLYKINALPWIEWGAGYGNLTAAFCSILGQDSGFASELDPAAFSCLEQNQKIFFPNLSVGRRAAERGPPEIAATRTEKAAELWLIDPPRSGFPELLEFLKHIRPVPKWVLAYHCHEKGLSLDSAKLKESGYHLKEWTSVDAFPATPHHEVISLWQHK